MTILVTGGAGFIGSNFILKWLESKSEEVVNLDALTYAGNSSNLTSISNLNQYHFVKGCIGDIGLVESILSTYSPKSIINFAAESHVDRAIYDPLQFIQTNIVATSRLLETVKNYWSKLMDSERQSFRFLHISTDEVYGSLFDTDLPFVETSQYQPNNPYSASKASSDHIVRAYHQTYSLPVLTINSSNNYGPFQFPEKLIPRVITSALLNKKIPIYGTGENIRDWLHVLDHCDAIQKVLEFGKEGEVYNVGGNAERTNIYVAQTICTILDEWRPKLDGTLHAENIIYVDGRVNDDYRYGIDSSKIQNELCWKPKDTFEIGIRNTVKWYLDNESWIHDILSDSNHDFIDHQDVDLEHVEK
tara:strand:- start:6351 stop:7430 length:1080 start_codon:yes stop_codon:yes gene_type:complete